MDRKKEENTVKIIVVGGGQTGVCIAKALMKRGCTISVLENRKNVFEKLQHDLPKQYIVNQSGSDPDALEAAGAADADALVAVTGEDEINIVASTTAKSKFHVPRVIARVNNPKNSWMFTAAMGVDVAVNQADLIESLVLNGGEMQQVLSLLRMGNGGTSVVCFRVEPSSPADGKYVRDLVLPKTSLLVGVVHGNETVLPHGDTQLSAGDDVLVLSDAPAQTELGKIFGI